MMSPGMAATARTAGGHEFIEVLNRRWCVCCDLFQRRRDDLTPWMPLAPLHCARSTPYAAHVDGRESGMESVTAEKQKDSP